jgi:hypothetical protein
MKDLLKQKIIDKIMRENLITLNNALNAANKSGAFTLQEAIVVINSFDAVVKFIGQYEDLSEPVVEKEVPVKKVRAKKA